MKKVTITQEIIDEFKKRHEHRPEKWKSKFVCKLCLPLWRASKKGLAEYWQPLPRNYFKDGQEVYEVTYPNGQIGYYHVLCVDKLRELSRDKKLVKTYPFYFIQLEDILRYDIDRWQGINTFIKDSVDKNQTDKQVIANVMSRFDCGHTTAWRKLRAFRNKTP